MKDTAYITSLVRKVRKKEILAMQTLYELYSKQMLATSQRITNTLADSEDIIQDAFIKSFVQIHQLNNNSKYGGWLKQIVINLSLKKVRSKINYIPVNEAEFLDSEGDTNRWYESIPFELIKTAILELPDGCRQVFTLYLMEEYKHKEIAVALDISISTSKSQYRYALKLLREKLINKVYE